MIHTFHFDTRNLSRACKSDVLEAGSHFGLSEPQAWSLFVWVLQLLLCRPRPSHSLTQTQTCALCPAGKWGKSKMCLGETAPICGLGAASGKTGRGKEEAAPRHKYHSQPSSTEHHHPPPHKSITSIKKYLFYKYWKYHSHSYMIYKVSLFNCVLQAASLVSQCVK